MNLIQTAMQKVFGLGKSRAAVRRAQERNRNVPGHRFSRVSRQTARAALRDALFDRVEPGQKHELDRRERRRLARAFASRRYREGVN